MSEQSADSPNVLLLVVDSLRYDATMGDWETDTPNIDRLADDGVSFSNCFSQGISTAPAMTALLTGRLPLDFGGHWSLQDDRPRFAEAFQQHGYHTGAFHSNPYVSERRNFDRGFDTFREDAVAFEPDGGLEGAPEKLLRLANRVSRLLSRTPYTRAEAANEQILDILDDADSPWFQWAQYMDVHGPYLGGNNFSYRNKFRAEKLWLKAAVRNPDDVTAAEHEELKENYRSEIEYLDDIIGELLDSLEQRGELEDTIVVLTADHGDEFYEHGRYGHGNLPYDELIHVPLVVRFPDTMDIPSGEPIDEMVRSVDILPTVLDSVAADIPYDEMGHSAGESLLPVIRGTERDEPPMVVTEKRVRGEEALRIGFRTPEWKFLHDGETGDRHLYRLTDDPAETTNLIDQEPEVAAEFTEKLETRFSRIKGSSDEITVPDIETQSGMEERLKALGYRE